MKAKTKEVLSSLFGTGGISMMRVLTFFVVVDIVVMWNITIIKNGFSMQDIPTGVLGVFTAMVLGKMGQRFAENKKEDENKA